MNIFPNVSLTAPVFSPELITGTLRFLASDTVRKPLVMGSRGNYYYFDPHAVEPITEEGGLTCKDTAEATPTGLNKTPYTVSYELERSHLLFSFTEEQLAEMQAYATEMNGAFSDSTINFIRENFKNQYKVILQRTNDLIAAKIISKIGRNPVDYSLNSPAVKLTKTNFLGNKEYNPSWEDYINEGLSENGLGATSFSRIMGKEIVSLRGVESRTVTGGNTNIDLRVNTGLFIQDNTYQRLLPEDGYGNILYIQDGVVRMDFFSKILSSANVSAFPTLTPEQRGLFRGINGFQSSLVGNEMAYEALFSQTTRFFQNAAAGAPVQKAVWWDEQNRLLWDIVFTSKDCGTEMVRELRISCNPQIIFIDPKVPYMPEYTGIWLAKVERTSQDSISPVTPPTRAAVNCISSISLDAICSSLDSFIPLSVELSDSDPVVVANGQTTVAIENNELGIYRVLKTLKDPESGNYLGFSLEYSVNGGMIIKTSLAPDTYTLNMGECGDIEIVVGNCEGDTVFANSRMLQSQRNANPTGEEWAKDFTYFAGMPEVGGTVITLPVALDSVLAVQADGVDLTVTADYTFTAPSTITLVGDTVTAGVKYSVYGNTI